MSARLKLAHAITRKARLEAHRQVTSRRGVVINDSPLTLQLYGSTAAMRLDNDFYLSQWAKLYDETTGIVTGDVVMMHREHGDWVLHDVVADTAGVQQAQDHASAAAQTTFTLTAGPEPDVPNVGDAVVFLDPSGNLKVIFDSGNVAVLHAYI